MKLANEHQVDIINDLIMKSTNDSKFKKEFIEDPKKILATSYQFNVYDDVKLVVEDQSDENLIFLNIPRKPDLDEMELTDEDLEKVAGGISPTIVAIGVGLAACAIYDFGCGMIDSARGK